jgi:hypothetical protein
MKKPLLPALPLCLGLLLLAVWLSLSFQHPYPSPPGLPLHPDTTPSTTVPPYSSRVQLNLYPPLLQGHYANINVEWQTLVNGLPAQKGFYLHHNFSATAPTRFDLPLRLPNNTGDEIILQVTGRLAAATGHAQNAPLFVQRLPQRYWRGDHSIPAAGDLSFTDSNDIFTISSARMQARFDKQTGWLLHYEAGGALLMGDSAGLRTDLGPADTMLPHLQLFFASTGTRIVIVKAEYTVPDIKCLLHLSYTINAAGDMLVEQVLEPDTTATPPESLFLPHFGMSWLLPHDLDSATSFADDTQRFSSITAPVSLSREESFAGVRWLKLSGRNGQGIRIIADSALLQMNYHPADGVHGPSLGMYKTIDSTSQRRFNYSYKVTYLTPATPPASHPPARTLPADAHAAQGASPTASHPARAAKPI